MCATQQRTMKEIFLHEPVKFSVVRKYGGVSFKHSKIKKFLLVMEDNFNISFSNLTYTKRLL